jgi:hypothetical protein
MKIAVIIAVVVFVIAFVFTAGTMVYRAAMDAAGPSFDKGFRDSCIKRAVQGGADEARAAKFCDCALVSFKQTKSMSKAAEACAGTK